MRHLPAASAALRGRPGLRRAGGRRPGAAAGRGPGPGRGPLRTLGSRRAPGAFPAGYTAPRHQPPRGRLSLRAARGQPSGAAPEGPRAWRGRCPQALRGGSGHLPTSSCLLLGGGLGWCLAEGRACAHDLSCMPGACRPCSDAEQLLVACTSDFVIHGTIHGVTHNTELQESVITVVATRVLRQTLPLFQVEGSGGQGQASIRTPLRCGVHSGPGTFLFMGWGRFGEAWLGCAPRFQEFSRAYVAAHAAHLHPCEVALD
ncbi:meteorin isoform X2 [Cynocephalus volans]|uniref:meteorin isoform X2 n=1 Tax=Cynocephalus volans TaxID=110931 RepID=UPI002FC8F046